MLIASLPSAAYEASPEVSPFSSKFDAYLAGSAELSEAERRGYDLHEPLTFRL